MTQFPSFVSIGDLCIDHYTNFDKQFLGGTAFNIAATANRIGSSTAIISAIGTDTQGKLFSDYFSTHNINTDGLSLIKGKTSSVDITLDNNASPSYTNWKLGVLEKFSLTKSHENQIKNVDIARIMHLSPISHLLDMFCTFSLPHTFKVADFDGETLYTENTSILTKYIDHLDMIIKSLDTSDTQEMEYIKHISDTFPDKYFLILLGKNGSLVYHKNQQYHQESIQPNEKINDSNGAGDTYIAQFLITLKTTGSIEKAMLEGAKKASESLTHFGAVE